MFLTLGGALRGRPAPAEGVAEKKAGKARFLWSEGETSPLKIFFDFTPQNRFFKRFEGFLGLNRLASDGKKMFLL